MSQCDRPRRVVFRKNILLTPTDWLALPPVSKHLFFGLIHFTVYKMNIGPNIFGPNFFFEAQGNARKKFKDLLGQ